ncbi:hypothetical protein LEP1GSC088_2714 [Leptospira interrogans str. L1207]|nr:hypothetical protein LEP1GSC088_2714 [Leptospira interrogans str. L1207]
MMILLVFRSSSHNFQSLTGKSTICKSSHIYFFTKKLIYDKTKTDFLRPAQVNLLFRLYLCFRTRLKILLSVGISTELLLQKTISKQVNYRMRPNLWELPHFGSTLPTDFYFGFGTLY